ncbi:hypothetical protein OfM1_13350 [Lactovum odontotermitis]
MKNIIIIDSYPDTKHPCFKDKCLKTYKFNNDKRNFEEVCQDLDVKFPHGTAIGGIIAKTCKEMDVIYHFFDIFSKDKLKMLDLTNKALEYISRNFQDGVINCSLGTIYYNEILESLIEKLSKKILIISAFDNAGAISYPAAFDSVIGVDTSFRCTKKDDFVVVKNSPIDIRAKGGVQRVPWVNPEYTINQGSSFACAYVTAYVAQHYYGLSKDKVMEKLEGIARFVYSFEVEKVTSIELANKNVAIVPYNKEIQSAFNFSAFLPFKVAGFYDFKFSGNIGRELMSFYDEDIRTIVENTDRINFENIDVLVIGHLKELSLLTHRDLKKELLEKCLKYHVEVLAFDSIDFEEYSEKFSLGKLNLLSVEELTPKFPEKFGKLFTSKTPVLGIFGTSSKQGKFTLQIQLRDALKKRGYDTGFIGTEPTSSLFNFDITYPIGYMGIENQNPQMILEHSNYLVNILDKMNKDLIVVGSQSGTIPQVLYNLGQSTLTQLAFLQGTNPDAVILAINFDDSFSYIQRTILTMKNLINCSVIGLALYPFCFKNGWGIISDRKEKVSGDDCKQKKKKLEEEFGIPVIVPGDKKENVTLIKMVENFFSGER